MKWLEVSLAVNGEIAEAVAEVLARFAPNGVATEQGITHLDAEDEGTPDGLVTVRAYLSADAHLAVTRRKIEEALHYLGMIQPLPAPVFRLIADQDWMEAWKQHYRPIPIGRRLIVVPSWLDSPDPTRIAIRIEPGMAFGTGTHPSTQLCLGLIEKMVVDRARQPNDRYTSLTLIDVGCGSGILSMAALKLGARSALGVDIDRLAIESARQNALLNGIGSELSLRLGSVQEILQGKYELTAASLVVANILAPVIVRLFEVGLADLVAPGGGLILSGILREQAASIIEVASGRGLHQTAAPEMGDWVALAMSR